MAHDFGMQLPASFRSRPCAVTPPAAPPEPRRVEQPADTTLRAAARMLAQPFSNLHVVDAGRFDAEMRRGLQSLSPHRVGPHLTPRAPIAARVVR
jgi:hypothetical protein